MRCCDRSTERYFKDLEKCKFQALLRVFTMLFSTVRSRYPFIDAADLQDATIVAASGEHTPPECVKQALCAAGLLALAIIRCGCLWAMRSRDVTRDGFTPACAQVGYSTVSMQSPRLIFRAQHREALHNNQYHLSCTMDSLLRS
jgi:hypothetical protein